MNIQKESITLYNQYGQLTTVIIESTEQQSETFKDILDAAGIVYQDHLIAEQGDEFTEEHTSTNVTEQPKSWVEQIQEM